MFNVFVNPIGVSVLKLHGFSFDYSDEKMTFRNIDGDALFEIIPNGEESIVLTRESVHYGEFIHILFTENLETKIHLRKLVNNFIKDELVHIDENGYEKNCY